MTKNRICATATGLPKISRRAFATAVCATPLAALPVNASGPISDYSRGYADALKLIRAKITELETKKELTPIQRLFRERQEKLVDYRRADLGSCGTAGERIFDEMTSIEKNILKQKATSLEDLAAKVLSDTSEGDFGISRCFLDECREISGFEFFQDSAKNCPTLMDLG